MTEKKTPKIEGLIIMIKNDHICISKNIDHEINKIEPSDNKENMIIIDIKDETERGKNIIKNCLGKEIMLLIFDKGFILIHKNKNDKSYEYDFC